MHRLAAAHRPKGPTMDGGPLTGTMLAAVVAGLLVGACSTKARSRPANQSQERSSVDAAGVASGTIIGTAKWNDDEQRATGVYVTATCVEPMTFHSATTVTDDLGRYRLGGLPPGEYVVSVEREPLRIRVTDGGTKRVATLEAVWETVPVMANGEIVHNVALWK